MKISSSAILLTFFALPASAQDPNANLVEAANRVAKYWSAVFTACPDPHFARGVLNAEVIAGRMKGNLLQIADPVFQFQTEMIDSMATLNGLEFGASSTVRAFAARYFDPKTGWTPWKQAAALTVSIRKENGKWSVQPADGVSFSEIPGGPETTFRPLKCDAVPKQ